MHLLPKVNFLSEQLVLPCFNLSLADVFQKTDLVSINNAVLSSKMYSCLLWMSSLFPSSRHRRAIQKSRGSKVRRAEGTMSEAGAPASTASNTGTTTSTSTTTNPANTAAASSSSSTANSTSTPTTAPTTSSSSGSNTSNTSSSPSSGTTMARQALPQISVYSGIPDRQTVQVSVCVCEWVVKIIEN